MDLGSYSHKAASRFWSFVGSANSSDSSSLIQDSITLESSNCFTSEVSNTIIFKTVYSKKSVSQTFQQFTKLQKTKQQKTWFVTHLLVPDTFSISSKSETYPIFANDCSFFGASELDTKWKVNDLET